MLCGFLRDFQLCMLATTSATTGRPSPYIVTYGGNAWRLVAKLFGMSDGVPRLRGAKVYTNTKTRQRVLRCWAGPQTSTKTRAYFVIALNR